MQKFFRVAAELEQHPTGPYAESVLEEYLRETKGDDAVVAIHALLGHAPKKQFTKTQVREWVVQWTGYSDWLVAASDKASGDDLEVCANLMQEGEIKWTSGLDTSMRETQLWAKRPDYAVEATLRDMLGKLDQIGRLYLLRWLTGHWKVQVPVTTVVAVLSRIGNVPEPVLMQRLQKRWTPASYSWEDLLRPGTAREQALQPTAFPLVTRLDALVDAPEVAQEACLLPIGLPVQWVLSEGGDALWTASGEKITNRFPERGTLPDNTILQGRLVPISSRKIPPTTELERRTNARTVTARLRKTYPVTFWLESVTRLEGRDLQDLSMKHQQAELKKLVDIEKQTFITLPQIQENRDKLALLKMQEELVDPYQEGWLLRSETSTFVLPRKPVSFTAVLLYVSMNQEFGGGHFAELTFGMKQDNEWIPVAKVEPKLSEDVEQELAAFVKAHTLERFGPVRTIEPRWVASLRCQSVFPSTRHKSRLQLMEPEMVTWNPTMQLSEANELTDLSEYLPQDLSP